MNALLVFGWALSLLTLAQGLFFALTPQTAIRYTLWKTRLIGARVAEPGRGTLILYRTQGIAAVAMACLIIFKLVTE